MLIDKPQVSLIDERGGLQRVTGPLARKLARGNLLEFEINERLQLIERRAVARLRLPEQSCYAVYQLFTLLSMVGLKRLA